MVPGMGPIWPHPRDPASGTSSGPQIRSSTPTSGPKTLVSAAYARARSIYIYRGPGVSWRGRYRGCGTRVSRVSAGVQQEVAAYHHHTTVDGLYAYTIPPPAATSCTCGCPVESGCEGTTTTGRRTRERALSARFALRARAALARRASPGLEQGVRACCAPTCLPGARTASTYTQRVLHGISMGCCMVCSIT